MISIFSKEKTYGGVSKSKGFFDFSRDANGHIQHSSIICRPVTDEELRQLKELASEFACPVTYEQLMELNEIPYDKTSSHTINEKV